MFDLLKKKLSKVVKALSKKAKEKKIEKPELISKPEIKPKPKKKIFKKVKEKIIKKIVAKKLTEEDLKPILEEMETDLIEADVALEVVEKFEEDLKKQLVGKEIKRKKVKETITDAIKKSLIDILTVPKIDLLQEAKKKKPYLILFLGYNGSGKTTSMAKLAKWLIDSGYSCAFAAADTFRAASIEQLEEHARKLGVRVIKHKYGADPAAVVFDAVKHAKAKGIDFILADTAGRMHTDENLMKELEKIIRVNKPDLKVLVIDSLTGNDAILQARFFGKLGVDAVIFTKVDVNEKGGSILSVTHELKKPILFLGNGQDYSNLREFDPEKFVSYLLT